MNPHLQTICERLERQWEIAENILRHCGKDVERAREYYQGQRDALAMVIRELYSISIDDETLEPHDSM